MKLMTKLLAAGSILLGTALAPMQAAATTSDAGKLTLFSKQNQGGERRIVTGNETDLTSLGANNFAWSLSAVGDWEICMDPGFRAGCRIVTGTISDLGTDGGAISSARHLDTAHAAVAAAPAANASAPAAQNDAPQASVYATIGFGKIKPELVLDATDAAVTGTYTATQSEAELDAIYRTGTYGITSGTLEGQFSGNRLTGYWYETAYNAGLQTWCEDEREGTHVYGRFVLTFSADRKSFTGLRTGCDVVPDPVEHVYETWNGTLVRKQAAMPAPSAAPSASATSTRIPGAKPAGRIAGSAARGAEDEINAKAEEAARKAARGLLGKVFGE